MTAVVAQRFFPKVDNISVPGEKVANAVDEVGKVYVDGDELVEIVLGGGEHGIDPRQIP